MVLVVVSVVDAYNTTAPASTLQSYSEPNSAASQATTSTCDRLPVENGNIERTVFAGISAPPRKRLRCSQSSSPLPDGTIDSKLKLTDGVAATAQPVCAAAALTPATTAAPSLYLPHKLQPLSGGRIIGTVWQPVQSQSTTAAAAAVSTSDGSSLGSCLNFLSINSTTSYTYNNNRYNNTRWLGSVTVRTLDLCLVCTNSQRNKDVFVTDTFLLTFFFFARELRDRSLERDREVSRRESCVWPGSQAGRWFCLGRLAGNMSFFFFCLLFWFV